MSITITAGDMGASESISYRWTNKEFLVKSMLRQLGLTEDDLENDPSWIKAKVRELNIDQILED